MSDPRRTGLDVGEAAFARRFVAESEWTFASTMRRNPHHYVVRGRTADPAGFDRFAGLIGAHGWDGEWGGRAYRYLDVDGHSYWQVGAVVNRKPVGRVPGDHGRPSNR